MAITLAPTTLTGAVVNSAYSQTITASGGTAPYTYAVISGSLPTGLSLSSGGVLSGTPTVTGFFANFTVRATDNVAATGTQVYTAFYVSGRIYWFICTNAAYPSAVPVVAGSQLAFNRLTANSIAGLNKTRHGVGDLTARPSANPIDDHLLCDGTAVSRVGFPQLFAEIGTTWGAGDGTTTFNVPNLVTATLPLASTAPTQTITGTTVSTGGTVTTPTTPAQTGGSTGGNVNTGGITKYDVDITSRL